MKTESQKSPVKIGDEIKIKIDRLGTNGEGIARIENFTIFIPLALPDEIVLAKIVEVKKNYAIAELKKLIHAGSTRETPICPYYPACGGCNLWHMKHSAQMKFKRDQIVDAVERIGKITDVKILPTLEMMNPDLKMHTSLFYRNKFQFPVGIHGKKILAGCFARGTHDIVNIERCLIQRSENDQLLQAMRDAVEKFQIPIYNEDRHTGILRHLMGRVGFDGALMAVFVTSKDSLPHSKEICKFLRDRVPNLKSIQQNIQPQRNNVILGRQTKILWGSESITDRIGEFEFQISARSFFQVNTTQAEVLYRKVLEFAELNGSEIVLDSYCGTGTISIFLAKHARKVFGIEIVSSAIQDAWKNARSNRIRNVEFLIGDANFLVPKLLHDEIYPDVIIVDPPRAGCESKVLETLAKMNPRKIIYVSCNPATLARDLEILKELGFITKKIQPVDMFPMTSHVESVSLILRK
ncbi:MAG: 23S rRNA (uracil(1939)-C(5))-methyltransferase RlmD [Selenomonadaceae bacterium]|nr:23S rRNA (uracil(1939)-C(5))-methyltransferase RlmD [Selenomonadaceae bacterium]